MKTVYLDGDEQLNINDSVTVQVITDDASCAVNIQTNGDLNLSLKENAGATVNLIEDGEFGIITEIHTGDLPYYTGPTELGGCYVNNTAVHRERSSGRLYGIR